MQCKATRRDGTQCKTPAIKGGAVCRMHGGGAPQVKKAAELRLAALVDPAIAQLAKLLKSPSPAVSLGACKDVLDRAGLKAADKTEVTHGGNITIEVHGVTPRE